MGSKTDQHTDTSHDEGNKVPASRLCQLECMEEGRAREEDNEDDSRRDGRDIPVEIIVVHPGSGSL
jgi:hypothetical protein